MQGKRLVTRFVWLRDGIRRSIGGDAGIGQQYLALWREEPRARAYLGATLVDEIGLAVSAWASAWLMTTLFENQRARASLMVPALFCFLMGAIISGPLADWLSRAGPERLAHWRWKVVLWGRCIETALLAGLALGLAGGPPTIARVLPYFMVSAFMKTALRSTRIAFSIDLLERSQRTLDEHGRPARDERGLPLSFKAHLGTFTAASALISTLATLTGLLLGGQLLSALGGRIWVPFAADVLTNLVFVWLVWRRCTPAPVASTSLPPESVPSAPRSAFTRFWQSHAEGLRFLRQPERRPLLGLLVGALLVEVITEAYDGKMITKHVLGGTDDAVRYAELGWTLVAVASSALLPLIFRRAASLGRIFFVTLSVDALCIAGAGWVAAQRGPHAIVPLVIVLSLDRTLTLASTSLVDVAQNSASSAAMRGRIAGSYALVVILGDIASQALAVSAEERWGTHGLLWCAGAFQAAVVALLAITGGRRLWRYGLRSRG
jgi:hypothetical protein